MKSYKVLFIICAIGLFNSCDLFDDSPCGEKQTMDIYLLGSSILESTTNVYYSYMDGNNRLFQWSKLAEQDCALEHVKFEARVALLDETTSGINARSRISWLFFFEEQVELKKSGKDLKGNGEAGLKQAFDPERGWFSGAVEVYFPTKGSYKLDTEFLLENVISVELKANYRAFPNYYTINISMLS
ncbi:MAG TPA: hypothetical protein PKA12_02030 [Saprospiraceae bacterium]|nr:hypothetical protein [Saprospiraceae bacterium]